MKITEKHLGEELIGAARAAEVLGVGKSNMAYYLSRENLKPIRIGSCNVFILSEVEQVAAEIAERTLKAHSDKSRKASEVVLKRGMFQGEIEVQEVSADKYVTLWRAGASKGVSQMELTRLRKDTKVPVYFHKGIRYILKADLVKIPNLPKDEDLF